MTTDIEHGGIDVSGAHEPSYYEVALTNRQVVVAFVILLTCLVASFLSGVWIGRESAVRAQEKLALLGHGARAGLGPEPAGAANGSGPGGSSLAGAAGLADNGGNGGNVSDRGDKGDKGDREKPEGQALQEFKFFADPHRRPATGANGTGGTSGAAADSGAADGNRAASAATADAGGGEDAGRDAASSAPAPGRAARRATPRTAPALDHDAAPAGEGEPLPGGAAKPAGAAGNSGATGGDVIRPRPLPNPPASGASGARAATTAKSAGARDGRATAGPAAAAEPAAGGGTSAGAAAGAAGGDLVIQVFSSADKAQADHVRDQLVGAGYHAYLSPITKNDQTMYRVRIGPFASRAAAAPVAEKVRKEHKLDTWITPQ